MQIPIIKFFAGNNFDTSVELSSTESMYLVEELKMGVDDQIVLEDELGIRYLAKIAQVGCPVVAEIQGLLNDYQSSGGRNELRGMLDEIRRARGKE